MENNMRPGWRTSSYTGNGGGNCVEVGGTARMILVRDTKDRTGPVLRFTPAAWRGFAEQLKRSLASGPGCAPSAANRAGRRNSHPSCALWRTTRAMTRAQMLTVWLARLSLRESEPADRDMLPLDSRSCRRPSGSAQ
jgi:Domain of unknown function (DUF397)